jgi:hypothetical protein
MGVYPQLLFLVLEADIFISPSPIFRVTLGTPQNKSLYMLPSLKKKPNSFWHPLYTLYTWKLDCGQTIWDKMEVLFGTSRWTLWAWWEHIGNITKQKMPSTPIPPPPKPKRKKLSPGVSQMLFYAHCGSACWAFLLTAWNFYFQNSLSSFSTWATTLIINWGYL